MINPAILYGTAAALALGLVTGWTVRDWKADSEALAAAHDAQQAQQRALAAVNKPAEHFETVVADIKPLEIETRNTIREVYRNVEVPADCTVPAAGVSVLEAARKHANAAAAGEPVSGLRSTPGNTGAAD